MFGGIELFLSLDDAGLPAGDAIDVFASRRFLIVGLFVFGVVVLFTTASVILAALVMAGFPSAPWANGNRWRRLAQVAAVSFAVRTVFITVLTPVFKPFHLRLARVLTVNHRCMQGPYLSTDAIGVHLVDGPHKRLLLIPAADVVSVALGSAPEVIKSAITVKSVAACQLSAPPW